MNFKKKIPLISNIFNKLSIYFIKKNLKIYQDGSLQLVGSRKETDLRWNKIKQKLIKDKIKNILDLGSAEGVFLKKASELEIFSLGIEADERRFLLSNYIDEKNIYREYGVIFNKISLKSIKSLPKFDSTLYLSVHHHILANLGEKKATLILKEIFNRCEKSMFFETAMQNENSENWNKNYKKNLKKMTEAKIIDFFKRLGAEKIEIMGYTKSYNEGFERPLFYIKK